MIQMEAVSWSKENVELCLLLIVEVVVFGSRGVGGWEEVKKTKSK